jgi:tetratricopeptide (TPR) repeat protein
MKFFGFGKSGGKGGNAVAQSEKLIYDGQMDEAVATVENALEGAADGDRGDLLIQWARALSLRHFNGAFDRTADAALTQAFDLASAREDEALNGRALLHRGEMKFYALFRTGWESLDDPLADFMAAAPLITDPRDQASNTFFIGLMHQNSGRADESITRFKEAMQIAEAHDCPLEHSYAIRHLGFAHLGKGELDAALDCFSKSLKTREEIGFRVFLPFSQIAMGYTHSAREETAKAGEYFEAAVQGAEALNSITQILFSRLARGGWRQGTGDIAGARDDFTFVRDFAKKSNYPERVEAADLRLKGLD